MTVSREKLYEQVWAGPMTALAKQYEVSSNYLARICERLGVPVPPRGYWEKVKVGRGPPKPPLPQPAPGGELEWSRGYWTRPRRAPRAPVLPLPEPAARRRGVSISDTHPLLVGAQEVFEKARPPSYSSIGFLRPLKLKLPDIIAAKETLPRALQTANALTFTWRDARTGCPLPRGTYSGARFRNVKAGNKSVTGTSGRLTRQPSSMSARWRSGSGCSRPRGRARRCGRTVSEFRGTRCRFISVEPTESPPPPRSRAAFLP